MLNKRWNVLAAVAAIILSSCVTRTVYVDPEPLPLPKLSHYPKVYEHELQCLTQDAYDRLVEQKTLLENDRDECRKVIQSTH